MIHSHPGPYIYASKLLYLFKKAFANCFKFIWISNQVWFPLEVDPKFMDKLSRIECEISKSLNNLYSNYIFLIFSKKIRAEDKWFDYYFNI